MNEILTEILEGDDGNVEILIEVDDAPPPKRIRRTQEYGPLRGGTKEAASEAFRKGMDLIRTCAEQRPKTRWQLEQALTGRLEQLGTTAIDVAVETGNPPKRAVSSAAWPRRIRRPSCRISPATSATWPPSPAASDNARRPLMLSASQSTSTGS